MTDERRRSRFHGKRYRKQRTAVEGDRRHAFAGKPVSRDRFVKLGRNDPCICKSGRKNKHCCRVTRLWSHLAPTHPDAPEENGGP